MNGGLYVQAYYAEDDDEVKVEDVGDAEGKAEDDAEDADPMQGDGQPISSLLSVRM